MIYICPFCGHRVSRAIKDGITTCNNCNRVFDSSPIYKILSASWSARLDNILDIECLRTIYELTDCEAGIVQKYVIEECYSHDELLKIVNQKTCLDHE